MKRYWTVLGCLLALATSHPEAATAQENQWVTNGPYGAFVFCISVHPNDPDDIYVGTHGARIFHTTDGGQYWYNLGDDTLVESVRDIAIHPIGRDTMFAGTGGGAFRSSNAGYAWERCNFPLGRSNIYDDIEIHPDSHNLVFAAGNGCFKSEDGGRTWQLLDLPCMADIFVRVDPHNHDRLYLGTQSSHTRKAIWRSDDLGVTWYPIHNDLDTLALSVEFCIDPVDSLTLYLARDGRSRKSWKCLAKTIDGGEHWFDISPEVEVPYIHTVRVSPFDRNVVFIATEDRGVMRSTDGGSTWEEVNEGIDTRTAKCIEFDTTSSIIYLGTYYHGIYRSLDGGDSWEKISHNITGLDCDEIAGNFSSHDTLYVASHAGVYKSVDGSATWERLSFPTHHFTYPYCISVDRHEPRFVYAGTRIVTWGGKTGFYLSTDAGTTWVCGSEGLPDSADFMDLDVAYYGEDRVIFLACSEAVYRSYDQGESWHVCDNGIPVGYRYTAIKVHPAYPELIFAGDILNRLYRSTDGGHSWERSDAGLSGMGISEIAFHPYDRNVAYVGTFFGGIFKTTDGGQNWEDINGNIPYREWVYIAGIAINPLNPDNVFVTAPLLGVFASHDGGITWEDMSTGLRADDDFMNIIIDPIRIPSMQKPPSDIQSRQAIRCKCT